MGASKPSVYDYLDYRKFLQDYYEYRKLSEPGFSLRRFAKEATLPSKSYLKRIIEGDFHITKKSRYKFSKGCGLDKKERDFFYNLIEFNKSSNLKDKNRLLKRIGKISERTTSKQITNEQYELLSKWYYMAVRSLVALRDFRPDPSFLARKLRGFISTREAKKALEVLLKLGLVENKEGKYIVKDQNITTVDEVKKTAVKNYHTQMIPVGVKALHKNSLEEREMRAITLSLSDEDAFEAKRRVKEFYRELLIELSKNRKGRRLNQIWQLNLQFFKLTKEDAQ